jgi:nitronate monooxygenase
MSLRRLLGTELALIQAPMAGVQGHALAAAVTNAGALGSVPAAMLSPAALEVELETLAGLTDRPFNVNFFCHAAPTVDPVREAAWHARLAPYYAELGVEPVATPGPSRTPFDAVAASILERHRPRVVSFHFGLPALDLVARVKACGAIVIASATTVAEARWLEARGVDAVIAQGLEAGGHRGMFLGEDLATQSSTLDLVADVARAVRVPVIAAGGIGDADAVRAALAAGAAGVQVGTAYLCALEATTGALHRAAVNAADPRDTVLTNLYSGRPARGLVSRLIRDLGPIDAAVPSFPLAAAALAPLRAAAERIGSADFTPLWRGAGRAPCRSAPAADITRSVAAGLPD